MQLKPIEEVYPLVEKYTPFVHEVFMYLNGYVNPRNPCRLSINMYSQTNYAEYTKPDIITVYLGSIVTGYMGNDEAIKRTIIMTIVHEMCHSEQDIDMLRYSKDPYYRDLIEKQNEGYAERWITAHSSEIYSKFKIPFNFSNYAKTKIQIHADDYQKYCIRNYYLTSIMDVIYRNENALPTLSDVFDSQDTITFHIDDSQKVILKINGEFNDRGVFLFNLIVNKYCRMNEYIGYFSIKTEINFESSIFDIPCTDIHLILSNKTIKPIVF